MTDPRSRGDATRDALIAAAVVVFGRDGFRAASTRAIAAAAGVQQALIGYHFGGKEGLYLAVFEHITTQLRVRLGPIADAIDDTLAEPVHGTKMEKVRGQRLTLLLRVVDEAFAVIVRDESKLWAQLIVREQCEPTEAFAVIYEGFMERMLGLLTRLVMSARGGGSEQDARLLVLTILGEMLVFRVGREGALRQLGWPVIGENEIATVQAHLRKSIVAQLSSPPAEPERQTLDRHAVQGGRR